MNNHVCLNHCLRVSGDAKLVFVVYRSNFLITFDVSNKEKKKTSKLSFSTVASVRERVLKNVCKIVFTGKRSPTVSVPSSRTGNFLGRLISSGESRPRLRYPRAITFRADRSARLIPSTVRRVVWKTQKKNDQRSSDRVADAVFARSLVFSRLRVDRRRNQSVCLRRRVRRATDRRRGETAARGTSLNDFVVGRASIRRTYVCNVITVV